MRIERAVAFGTLISVYKSTRNHILTKVIWVSLVIQKVIYNPICASYCCSVDVEYTFYFSTSAQILLDESAMKLPEKEKVSV